MKKINFDSGVQEFQLGSAGVLRFNPADPNLYARFMEAAETIKNLEQELSQQAKELEGAEDGSGALKLLKSADGKMKDTLNQVFGGDTDFDKLLGGVNLLAVGKNGERVVTNLFAALQPVLLAGAESCTKEQVQTAVSRAKSRRSKQ